MTDRHGFLQRDEAPQLAFHQQSGSGPTVVWLGGFRSDLGGTKAVALAEAARERGWPMLRFDYAAHGESGGRWENCTIGSWRQDALDAIDALSQGPLVLVGSSMGGWMACLVALARPERVKAMVLIAPAPDFTEALMRPALSKAQKQALETTGAFTEDSEYGAYAISQRFLEDGKAWSILPGPVAIGCPVRILQGEKDEAVPWAHALELAQALESLDVVFTLVRDGDHRLSRERDIARLIATVAEAVSL